jgi:hypothetical protein
LAWLFVLAAAEGTARAADIGSEGSLTAVEIHGFASQGFILTKDVSYLSAKTTEGSFRFSEVGINLTKSIGDRLRIGAQLFAQNLGPTGNYNAKMDWFYLDYRLFDWLGLRAGRAKIPFGLYNEINDIDSARNPILLPQSVYPIQNRNYLLAQTGGELYGYLKVGAAGALDYRAYAGTIYFDTTSTAGSPYQILRLDTPFVVGGRLLWETPIDGMRLGGSIQTLRLDTDLVIKNQIVNVEIPALLVVGSAEYAAHDLLVATEYSRWYVKADSSNGAVFPGTSLVASERAYAMINYRVTRWLQPGAYYALYFTDVDHRDGRDHYQHDVATTLRFDVTANWLVKLEGHYMHGTANLDPTLNGNRPLGALPANWSAFLAKTTAYF